MTDLPVVAILLGAVLLLSILTIPAFASWRHKP